MAAVKDITEEKATEKLEKIMGTDKKLEPANDVPVAKETPAEGEKTQEAA